MDVSTISAGAWAQIVGGLISAALSAGIIYGGLRMLMMQLAHRVNQVELAMKQQVETTHELALAIARMDDYGRRLTKLEDR